MSVIEFQYEECDMNNIKIKNNNNKKTGRNEV